MILRIIASLFLLVIFYACNQPGNNVSPVDTKSSVTTSTDGEKLFKINCLQCHRTNEDFIAPALKDVRKRWKDQQLLFDFVRNSKSVIARDEYARDLYMKWNETFMQPFPNLSNESITAIFEYADRN